MPIESWTNPADDPHLAAHATAMIDAALVGTGLAREAYWAAVRKGYNTPYNDPPPKRAAPADPDAAAMPDVVAVATVAKPADAVPLPLAAIAAMAVETRAV